MDLTANESRQSISASERSSWEVAPPVLFNAWKHHAAFLRQQIADAAGQGEAGLAALPDRLRVVGGGLMDLYTGPLTPAVIGERVVAALRAEGRLEREAYRAWVDANGGYRTLTLAEDGSVWVLRAGAAEERYMHVHPGRWAPATRRVRANVLKTAVLVQAYVGVHGGDPYDVALVNRVRRQYLGLAPIRDLAGDQGLGAVLGLLGEMPDD